MKNPESFSANQEKIEYRLFKDFRERDDVFNSIEGLVNYVKDNGIKNIIFMDRSARSAWIGFDEYWKTALADKEEPGIYFMNPRSVKEQKDPPQTNEEKFKKFVDFAINKIKDDGMIGSFQEFDNEFNSYIATSASESDFINEVKENYKTLLKDKDEPNLIFDICAHTGESIKSIKKVLEGAGFSNLKVLTCKKPDQESGVITEQPLTEYQWFTGCYPFGPHHLVKMKAGSIMSKPDQDPENRAEGVQTRKEIKQIVKDRLANQEKLII